MQEHVEQTDRADLPTVTTVAHSSRPFGYTAAITLSASAQATQKFALPEIFSQQESINFDRLGTFSYFACATEERSDTSKKKALRTPREFSRLVCYALLFYYYDPALALCF
jgi:hypothetical protein